MVTPTKDEIRERALKLFFRENPTGLTPEDEELKESGYWARAQQELMRSEDVEALAYVEQLANDVGRRLVTEADHDKLIDIELRTARIKKKSKKLAALKNDLERLRRELISQGKKPVVTVEKIVKEIKWRTRKRRKKRLVEKALHIPEKQRIGGIGTLHSIAVLSSLDDLGVIDELGVITPEKA